MRNKVRDNNCKTDDNGKTAADQAVADSFTRVSLTRDRNSYRLAGSFDPLRGGAIQAALAREYRWLCSQPELTAGLAADRAMAQALHDLILRGDFIDRATGSTRANVTMLVLTDRETLERGVHDATVAETEDGADIDPATAGRLSCDAALRRLDVLPDSKRTVLSELVPISCRWHHLIHEGGWTLTMDADRTLTLSRPDGTVHRPSG